MAPIDSSSNSYMASALRSPITILAVCLKDKYPNFEVGLKCIIMAFQYYLLYSYKKENAMLTKNARECYLARRHWPTRDPYPEL